MSHGLVFIRALADSSVELCDEGALGARALMVYRKVDETSVPWHRYGTPRDSWSWEAFDEAMQVSSIDVLSSDSYSRVIHPETGAESFVRVPSEQHLRLHLGNSSIHVGTMGQNYALLSRREFYSQVRPFIEAGFSLDTAGDLAGGARSWFQVDLGANAMVEIRKGDPVRASALFMNSYDGSLAYGAGLVTTRVVCANTLAMARSELREAGSIAYKAKHSGNIQGKSLDIAGMIQGHLETFKKNVETYKRLDAMKVRSQLDLLNFASFYASDASDAVIRAKVNDIPKVSSRSATAIEQAWEKGIGSRRESFWDLFNAATFDLTHSLGNAKQGERPSERISRRLDSLMFGVNTDKLTTALRVAETMVSALGG